VAIASLVAGCAGVQYSDTVTSADLTQSPETEVATTVLANAEAWRNSGVTVRKGVTYRITAKGRWTAGGICGWTGPDGAGAAGICFYAFVRNGTASALIGRIGEAGTPFYVGADLDLVANEDGTLVFRINDGIVGDNEGSVQVKTAILRTAVVAQQATPARAPAPSGVQGGAASSGSGFLIRDSNLILTSLHVVRDRSHITLRFPSGEEYAGQVVFRDRGNDLALVEAKGLTPTTRGLVIASGTEVKIGDAIHALGYPLGAGLSRQPSMVSGTISSTLGLEDDIARFRMTAPINPGNSGGPVVNDRGQIIGIAAAGLVREGVEAVRFGVKALTATALLQQARLTMSFDVVVRPIAAAPRPANEIFTEVSPSVVLIEAR
jgi:S1-C subfamily serine protease